MLRSPNTFRKYHDAELTLDDEYTQKQTGAQITQRSHIIFCILTWVISNIVYHNSSCFISLPGSIQWKQLYSLLQHGLEAQSEREGNLSCVKKVQKELPCKTISYLVARQTKSHFCACHIMHHKLQDLWWVRSLLVTNPEKVQFIQPPMRIMGSTLVTFPFIMSVSMLGSVKWCSEQMYSISLVHLFYYN